MSNCIFWGNSAKSARQIGGGTTDVTYSCVQGGSALIANTTKPWLDLSELNLTPSTTYYWQVNEVNDLADPPVHVGPVWHFTTP